MKKTLLLIAGATMAVAGAAQAQDNTTSYGPLRFGLSAGPAYVSPFDSSAARFERDNPVNSLPWTDRANAAPSDKGPELGPEGSGTPMSRGGINDTLTGASAPAILGAPAPAKHKAARTKKAKAADAGADKPKP
ncbi:MAG TPA: hypothetical protein VHA55_13255 [Pseudorhodoplanes sp.]|jgi:hypothetical protein|nr:hypothetical protein [Pseudorhodoplanes sp.]